MKKHTLLFIIPLAVFMFVAGIAGQAKAQTSVIRDSLTVTSPQITVTSPKTGEKYGLGATVPIVWNPRNVDADYYYVLLENTLLRDTGFVVTGKLPKTSTSTSFIETKSLINSILANSSDLTEEQLKDKYYVRVVAMKNGTTTNISTVITHSVSDIFSFVTSNATTTATTSNSIFISNTSAKSTPIDSGNNQPAVGSVFNFNFTLTAGNKDVFVGKTTRASLSLVFTLNNIIVDPNKVYTDSGITVSPSVLAGDTKDYFIIPARTSRQFTDLGLIKSRSGSGVYVIRMSAIRYGLNANHLQGYSITSGLENLRILQYLDSDDSNTTGKIATSTPAPTYTPSPKPNVTSYIKVNYPNGGETYFSSSTINFYGYASYPAKNLVAYLYSSAKGNVATKYLASTNSASSFKGSFYGDSGISSGRYKIVICDLSMNDPANIGKPLCDSSDNYFDVIISVPAPVTYPRSTPIPTSSSYYSPTTSPSPYITPSSYITPRPSITPVPTIVPTPTPIPPTPTPTPVQSSPRPSSSPQAFNYTNSSSYGYNKSNNLKTANIWDAVFELLKGL